MAKTILQHLLIRRIILAPLYIVRRPKVFLFDEPLSNLDAKLRTQMRIELQRLHREINATIIYVTHDQMETMTLGHRIAVLNKGKLMQVDTPLRLYNAPANKFVAGFYRITIDEFFERLVSSVSTFENTGASSWSIYRRESIYS